MNQPNYQKELTTLLTSIKARAEVPTLLLHSCCAPCSSYVLEYLREFFKITVFYYNPNITDFAEYDKRSLEQAELIKAMAQDRIGYPVSFYPGIYEPKEFYQAVKGFEREPEGGSRCTRCFYLRLEQTAKLAREKGFDYFVTSLTISPKKDALRLNEIGKKLGEEYHVPFLPSDFKKKNGYQRSVFLSRQYGLYRQNYCGCIYSKREQTTEETIFQ